MPASKGAALLLLVALLLPAGPASAQGYIDQDAVEEVLEGWQSTNLDELPEVYYNYHVLSDSRGNTVMARNAMFKLIGNGDPELGQRRSKVVALLNRVLLQNLGIGDTLVVPTEYEVDFRAYSPFPRYYPGGRDFDKLFIIEKSIQAWAAYEHGQLARWGIVNTGSKENPTPTGRYNFNWKEEHRVSSLSPPGETWDMYWVFNFHNPRGIHIHQYAMPAGAPESHGCVRLVDADARWIYNWADAWTVAGGGNGFATAGRRVIKPGTTVLVLGQDPPDHPTPFEHKKRYPILRRIELPIHPYDVPAGTDQQRHFDRLRASR